ncbi:MAG: hypothetical protein ACRBK7_03080 [Acidimicrobiales bacterium]
MPLAGIWFLGCSLLVGLVLQRQVPYGELLLDPNSLNKVPWYTGLVSNLGILCWTTATSTAFFGSWLARFGGRQAASVMLGRGAVLSAILLLDDLFQLHVAVKPLFGISKAVVYLAYLLVAGWWVATQRKEIQRTRSELLLASLAAFGGSVVVDQLGDAIPLLDAQAALLIEDACKFLGVLAWAQYFVLTSSDIVKSIVGELRAKAANVEPQPVEPPLVQAPMIDGGYADAIVNNHKPNTRSEAR